MIEVTDGSHRLFMRVTHANLKTPIEVVKAQVFAYYYSDTHKCVLLLATGGAMIPVSESLEEVREKMQSL